MTRRTLQVAISVLVLGFALELRADEPGRTSYRVSEDGHVYPTTAPPSSPRGAADSPAPTQPPAAPAAERSCESYDRYVKEWRLAKRLVDMQQEKVDKLGWNPNEYVQESADAHAAMAEAAQAGLEQAERHLEQTESVAAKAGVPQKCFED